MAAQDERGAILENGSYENALTALSTLSMAALGHLPSDPTPEGRAVRKALDFLLLDSQRTDGAYFGAVDNSRMYGHGIATLLLTEMLGMGANREQDDKIRTTAKGAVEWILRSQATPKRHPQFTGGWRYKPNDTESDLSISIWQLLALRSAKNAGISVPDAAIESALGFLKGLFQTARTTGSRTGFAYLPGKPATGFSTTCAGMLAFQVCGRYDAPETEAVAEWMLQHPPEIKEEPWFYYGTYYYAQCMNQHGGVHAEAAQKRILELLLPMQEADGSWKITHDYENKRVYRTAFALLSLSIKYNYLPIYQR
jgi:hypothetical protein